MIDQLIDSLVAVNKEIAVLILAAMPVAELRGAMPLAFALGFSPLKSFLLAVIGNLIPIIPLLFFLEPVSERLRRIKIFKGFFDWLFERTKRKASLIEKFEAVGLCLFVAVPLPGTGAWTGAIAATIFKMRFRYAFLSITIGVILAGVIVFGLCIGWKSVGAYLAGILR